MPKSFGLRQRPGGFWYGVPVLLGLLALLDLRVELQLLADHFTLAAVGAAPLQPPAGGGCNGAVTLPYNSLSR